MPSERLFSERLRAFERKLLSNLDLVACPVHLSLGQEEVSAAIFENVRPHDWVFSTHRNHGHYLAKGGSEDRLWDEICGLPTGINGGLAGSQCFSDPSINFHASSIVGGSIGIAVGTALGIKGSGNIVVCCLGDAATEQGIFWESINFASLKQLPIFFICENNDLSINVPISQRQTGSIWWKVAQFGVNVITTEGEIDLQGPGGGRFKDKYDLGFHYARHDEPAFIEVKTKREGDHCYFPKA